MDAVTFSESGGVRYLHFGSDLIQGAMRLRDPDEIYLEYNQQMMAWLLFLETRPGMRVAQLGLGTGALTKFQYRYCKAIKTTVVELNPAVIVAARSMFFVPDDDRKLETLQVDAKLFVNNSQNYEQFDALQVDLYDAICDGPAVSSLHFYKGCFNILKAPGVMTVNLFSRHPSFKINLKNICEAFGKTGAAWITGGDLSTKHGKEVDPTKQLTVALYNEGIAEVSINKNSLDSFMALVNHKNDAYVGFETLQFYIVNSHDPSKLYDNIRIDTTKLINNGSVNVSIPWYSKPLANKITVYTKRVFSSYQVASLDVYIRTPEKDHNKSMQYMSDQSVNDDCHISINIKDNTVEINSNIIDPIKFKIFDKIDLHVIKKNDPNQYVRTIKLTADQLKNKGTVLLGNILDDTMAVVHDNPSVKVNLRTVNESTNNRI